MAKGMAWVFNALSLMYHWVGPAHPRGILFQYPPCCTLVEANTGTLVDLIETCIAGRMSYLPRPPRCRHRERRIGACACQPSIDIFLSYPLGCICEVVHDAMMVALCVAGHARASALHTTQSWIELGRFQVIAINHVRQVIAINHACAEVMQPDVLLSAAILRPATLVRTGALGKACIARTGSTPTRSLAV